MGNRFRLDGIPGGKLAADPLVGHVHRRGRQDPVRIAGTIQPFHQKLNPILSHLPDPAAVEILCLDRIRIDQGDAGPGSGRTDPVGGQLSEPAGSDDPDGMPVGYLHVEPGGFVYNIMYNLKILSNIRPFGINTA